jgi:lipopolysaccharide export LptBFGC system permease protein LptF
MKILDRYVLTTFLKNYVLSFMVLVGLYVMLDMLFNFDELMAPQAKEGAVSALQGVWGLLRNIGDYYFYQIFLVFVHMSGIIPVVAAAFTLMRFSRFNELSAMLSSGVPLLRVTMPIIIASVVLNGLLLVDQEAIIPQMIPQLVRSHTEVSGAGNSFYEVHSMQVDENNILVAGRYTPPSPTSQPTLEELSIIERDPDLQPVRQISAKKAVWDRGKESWKLTDAQIMTGLRPGETPSTQPWAANQPYRSGLTPEEIGLYRSGDYTQLLSTEKINKLLNESQRYGANQLMRVKHTRFTQPLLNIILLLLAIPCVLTREPGQLRSAAMKCLILTGVCMAAIFVTSMLAGQPPKAEWASTWPAVMAWVPIFIFGPISVWLLDRVKT